MNFIFGLNKETLQTIEKVCGTEVTKQLTEIKELLNTIMLNQKKVDELTAQINANTTGVKETIVAEADEVKAAIEATNVDTTALEAAIAASETLSQDVKDIFTPAEETPEETEA